MFHAIYILFMYILEEVEQEGRPLVLLEIVYISILHLILFIFYPSNE